MPDSQPSRMACGEFQQVARLHAPARAFSFLAPGGVEPEAGDDGKGVAGAGIDGDPAPAPGFAPGEQAARWGGGGERAGVVEHEGDGAGAIVADVEKRGVAAAPAVGLSHDAVHGPDRVFHHGGGVLRGVRDFSTEHGDVAGDGGVFRFAGCRADEEAEEGEENAAHGAG